MTDRARPLLKYIPGETGSLLRLKKGRPAVIEVTLPAGCDKAMQRDGVEPKPPQGLGEKAWWLIQILEFVPLELWTNDWRISPADLLAASLQSEWKKELFEAWTRAAIRQRSADWADVLFGAALDGKKFDKFEGLLSAMFRTQRELRLSELLAANDAKTRDFHGTLIAHCPGEWSVQFSRTVLAWLRRLSAEPSNDWQLRNQIKDFVPRLAPSILPEVPAGWPIEAQGWEFWSKGAEEFFAVAQFRADLRAAFVNEHSNT
jgi:hypothetical protein